MYCVLAWRLSRAVERQWVLVLNSAVGETHFFRWSRRVKGEGKIHPRTGHKVPEGELKYSSTLPSTSALDGVGGERHAPAT